MDIHIHYLIFSPLLFFSVNFEKISNDSYKIHLLKDITTNLNNYTHVMEEMKQNTSTLLEDMFKNSIE